MTFKKLGSIVLAVAMILSVMSFQAFAGGDAYYEMTYENISRPNEDIKLGDFFYAVITLKNATTLFGGQIVFTYDPSVVQLYRSNLTAEASSFTNGTVDRIVDSLKFYDEDDEMYYEYFEENTGDIDTVGGKVHYTFTAAMIGGNFQDYDLSGDQLIFKARFKALAAGDPQFTYVGGLNGMKYFPLKNQPETNPMEGVTPLVITAEDQDQAAPDISLFTAKAPTSDANNDGMILGTTTDMEYKLASDPDTAYVACTGTSITGLAAGDYDIRYAAKTGFKASPAVTVTVPPYVPVTGTRITVANLTDINSGAEFNVPITITELPAGTKVKGFEFGVRFDSSVLEYKSYTTTDGYESTTVDTSNLTSGKLGVAGVTSEEGVDGDVLVVTLKFAAKAELATQVTDIELFDVAFSNESNAAVEIPETNIFNGTIGIVEVTDPLVAAKTAAKAELEAYYDGKDQALYSDAGKAALLTAKNDGISAIEAAADVAAVDAALASAKSAIDAVKTAAQELADYKATKKADLDTYYGTIDLNLYTEAGKDALEAELIAGKAAIDAAESIAAVDEAYDEAIIALYGVPTAVKELDEKVKENEEITIDDITAAGAEGVLPEKLNSYKVALAITRANDGDLDLTKIQAAIDEANTVDEADRGNVYIGAGDENLSVNDAVGARDIRLRKAGFTVAQAVRADENGDGAVDVQDVINILQRVAKKQSDNVPDKQ